MLKELKEKEFSLSLSGGGALGFAHLGVISVLEESNIYPNEILGTSMGGIIGALYSIGLKESEITAILGEFSSVTKWIKLSFKGNAIIDTKRIEKIFTKIFKDKTFKETKIPLKIVATNLKSSTKVTFSKDNNIKLVDALLSTMAIPGIFKEHIIDDRIFVDGFLCENLPLLDASYSDILAVDVLGKNSFDTNLPKNFFKTTNVLEMFEKSMRTLIYTQTKRNIECIDKNIILIEPKTKDLKTYNFNKLNKLRKRGIKAIIKD